ncbi:pantoate--beta-alanine ligase [Flavobacterium tibetense]|uniref:Pantothenate synthetase n=1 Tax=Flavobacterium tibetense TaxID=2233533 RepID=A0A365P5K8_9FLAO|nr:pantoate--beta-alanine ligase [Flavobacterium tibetense]RBA29852.1 pantoate--beta-alanine ligase [Flavobacterium tibetense]
MLIFDNKESLTNFLRPLQSLNKTTGFVPTMGALHDGHLSLIKNSLDKNHVTVVSIFVNPTQFNNVEDLEKYPRTLEADVKKIKQISTQVLVYAPTVSDIYQEKTSSSSFSFDGLENQMEGKHRPGHFDGVGTIVKKLFEIVNPTNAYFGEKDFQQLQIVKKLVEKEKMNVEIIGCPIFREANGLAMSSRNERLSKSAREQSSFIYKTLQAVQADFKKKSLTELNEFVKNAFSEHPEFSLEYFEIAEESTLLPALEKDKTKKYRAFIAIFIENIRLIDNISLN